MAKSSAWQDEELQVLMSVLDGLWKLDTEAQVRVLRYVTRRLDLLLLVLGKKPERCEEIGPVLHIE